MVYKRGGTRGPASQPSYLADVEVARTLRGGTHGAEPPAHRQVRQHKHVLASELA